MVNVAYMVRECVNKYQVTEPILVEEVLKDLNNHKDAVYVTLNRLVGEGLITNYRKGIYYKPKESRFGQIGIDKRKLIEKKYLKQDHRIFGYITGPQIWNEWGLTTQMPNRIWIAQNIRQRKVDIDLNVMLIKAKGKIKNNNIKALQFLDVIEQIENIQDTRIEDVIRKLIGFYREKFEVYDRIAMFEEVKNYTKKVKVLFGLVAESSGIKNEYFCALLNYLKEDVQNGKKIIIDINPDIFNNNRSWGNGYALAQKY